MKEKIQIFFRRICTDCVLNQDVLQVGHVFMKNDVIQSNSPQCES